MIYRGFFKKLFSVGLVTLVITFLLLPKVIAQKKSPTLEETKKWILKKLPTNRPFVHMGMKMELKQVNFRGCSLYFQIRMTSSGGERYWINSTLVPLGEVYSNRFQYTIYLDIIDFHMIDQKKNVRVKRDWDNGSIDEYMNSGVQLYFNTKFITRNRLAKAFEHAAKLCGATPKPAEPFE